MPWKHVVIVVVLIIVVGSAVAAVTARVAPVRRIIAGK